MKSVTGPARLLLLPAFLIAWTTSDPARVRPTLDTLDTSTPVTILDSEAIERTGARTYQDLVNMIPSLQQGEGVAEGTNVLIDGRRQFVVRGTSLGSGRSLTYIDGVPQVEPGFINGMPLQGVQRVEVARGSAPALYGSGATAGIVNIVTRQGQTEPLGRFSNLLQYYTTRTNPDLFFATDYASFDYSGGLGSVTGGFCDFTTGSPKPFNMYFGGARLGGPIIRDRIWFFPGASHPYKAAGGTRQTGEETAQQGDRPSPPSFTGSGTSFGGTLPGSFAEWNVPPAQLVQQAPDCPGSIKNQVVPFYQGRDQARLEWAYLLDHSHFANQPPEGGQADRRMADEAVQRWGLYDESIRSALQQCTPGAADRPAQISPSPSFPAVVGFSYKINQVILQAEYTTREPDGSLVGSPAAGAKLDLYPVNYGFEFFLPHAGTSIRNTDLGASESPSRYFADQAGQFKINWNDLAPRVGARFDPRLWSGAGDYRWTEEQKSFDIDAWTRKYYGDNYPRWSGANDSDAGATDGDRSDPEDYSLKIDWDVGQWTFRSRIEKIDSRSVELGGMGNFGIRSVWDVPPSVSQGIPAAARPYLSDAYTVGADAYLTFDYPEYLNLNPAIFDSITGQTGNENNVCSEKALPKKESATQRDKLLGDQWAFERVGASGDAASGDGAPIVVGIVDSGLDWNHLDLSWENIWRNEDEVPGNGVDDDGNGYVDDIIGWDFPGRTNRPWDYDGHGTFVTGIVAATRNNGQGIAGVSPTVKIMVLKALNSFGQTRASFLAQAIVYGADNGARILNLSVAGPGMPRVVQKAIRYAESKGVLVIAAAGNTAESIDNVEPAGMEDVLTVAATDSSDKRANFSNWGAAIDVAAPGVDVVSLRGRRTDFRLISADGPYKPGEGYVGEDRRYYRATGTSFAAPFVTGIAALVWSRNPDLDHRQVRRIVEQSARDIETPGKDYFTGYGIVDARNALAADPEFFIEASIQGAAPAKSDGKLVLQVMGTADADKLAKAWLEIGAGEAPSKWKKVAKEFKSSVRDGVLEQIPAEEFKGSKVWILRLVAEHRNGKSREARYRLTLN